MKSLDFKRKKQMAEKISMLTCYDYPSAKMAAESAVDCLLVGDSVAMTVHGHSGTHHATMDMMRLHTQAVARGLGEQFLIADLPFLSYRTSLADTMQNVQSLIQAGAHAVKLEGGDEALCQTITQLTQAGIAVIGHIGLTPQAAHQLGGHRVQGRQPQQAARLCEQAEALEQAGCLAIVLECIPSLLAKTISESLSIPTIGIGAGPYTDGQVLVWHDLLGLQTDFMPKFVKQYTLCKPQITEALNAYHDQVKTLVFPTLEHAYE